MSKNRKWPNVSILSLTEKGWNEFLQRCFNNLDISELTKALYGIQADMTDLASNGMNYPKVNEIFCGLQRSLEETARQILKVKYPMSLDNQLNNPLIANRLLAKGAALPFNTGNSSGNEIEKDKALKRKRDSEFEKFIKDSSF